MGRRTWVAVGLGAGFRRVREAGLGVGCFGGGGGKESSEPDEGVIASVDSERRALGECRRCRGTEQSGEECVRVTREVAASIISKAFVGLYSCG